MSVLCFGNEIIFLLQRMMFIIVLIHLVGDINENDWQLSQVNQFLVSFCLKRVAMLQILLHQRCPVKFVFYVNYVISSS